MSNMILQLVPTSDRTLGTACRKSLEEFLNATDAVTFDDVNFSSPLSVASGGDGS